MNEGPILSDSINTWFATDQGKTCLAEPATGKYLKNRLEAAFIAGWDAHKKAAPLYVQTRYSIIEECAQAIESAPLTYAGPDPQGVRNLRFLIVEAIRGLKSVPISGSR